MPKREMRVFDKNNFYLLSNLFILQETIKSDMVNLSVQYICIRYNSQIANEGVLSIPLKSSNFTLFFRFLGDLLKNQQTTKDKPTKT